MENRLYTDSSHFAYFSVNSQPIFLEFLQILFSGHAAYYSTCNIFLRLNLIVIDLFIATNFSIVHSLVKFSDSLEKYLLPHPLLKLRDREVACSASHRQGSNFESCVWRAMSSHHPQDVLLAQFSLYVHKSGLKSDSFHF